LEGFIDFMLNEQKLKPGDLIKCVQTFGVNIRKFHSGINFKTREIIGKLDYKEFVIYLGASKYKNYMIVLSKIGMGEIILDKKFYENW
jgi:hypothetical protein